MKRLVFFSVFALSIINSSSVSAASTDTETKAYYCYLILLNVQQEDLAFPSSITNDPQLNSLIESVTMKFHQRLDRLKAHMPIWMKMANNDPLEMMAVIRSVERDIQYHDQQTNMCTSRCGQAKNLYEVKACLDKCWATIDDGDTGKRINSCNDLSWLPY
jgi:hypothetical protein